MTKCILKLVLMIQDPLGRTVSDSTLEWWGKQDHKIMEEAFDQKDAITVDEALTKINKWLVGVDNLWGQGYGFDYTILEDMYRCAGKSFWNFRIIYIALHCLVCAKKIP